MRQISKFKILLVNLTLVFCFQTYGQVKISGKVCDNNTGETLLGVNIIELGTENKTVSEMNGSFTLTVSNSESGIEITSLGYKKQEIKIGDKRYFDIKLKEDCFLDFFDYNKICFGLSSGILNSPIGGFGYIKQPIRKIVLIYGEFDYQTDLKNNYKMEVQSGLLHLVAKCDYNGDVYLNYRKIANQNINFNNYSLIGKLNFSKPRIFHDYSTLYFGYGISSLKIPNFNYNNKSGYILGFGTFITKPLYIDLITTYWTNYWEYTAEIKWEHKNMLISMNYDKIKNYNELNLKLGYIFNYQ